jgi:hypothetical protein
MLLYKCLHSLQNVLVQIANQMGLQKSMIMTRGRNELARIFKQIRKFHSRNHILGGNMEIKDTMVIHDIKTYVGRQIVSGLHDMSPDISQWV